MQPPINDSPTITKIYDVSDLRTIVPNYTNAPQFDLNSSLQGGVPFRDTQIQIRPETKIPMQEIADLIQDMVEPDYWFEHPDAIRIWGGNLIVTAPQEIHRKIQ